MVISKCVDGDNKTKDFLEKIKSGDVDGAEMEYCGSKTAKVSANIFDHWKFEPELVAIIENSDEPENAPDEIKVLAASLKAVRSAIDINARITPETKELALSIVDKFELDRGSFENAVDTLAGT